MKCEWLSFLVGVGMVLTGAQAQTETVFGQVLDAETQAPLPYVNIGIPLTTVGTISNRDGSFQLHIPEGMEIQYVRFSAIGYGDTSIAFTDFRVGSSVQLNPKPIELQTLEVFASRANYKSVELGNGRSFFLSGQLHFDDESAGSAMAILINKSEFPNMDYPIEGSLYISKNRMPEFKVRMRILSVDNNGVPGEDLLPFDIIQTSSISKGWLSFPVEHAYRLEVDSFFLVFEWILDQADRNAISEAYGDYMETYPERVSYDTVYVDNKPVVIPKINRVVAGTIFGVTHSDQARNAFKCFYRSNSFGEWKSDSGILSARIVLANQRN